jgi:hypothetical protein
VLFDDDGNAFLSDFGIATVMAAAEADATRAADLTQAGLFIGSPLYAPPEAVVRDLRPQYDQYSLALIAYQCLTGAFPFEADSGPQMMTAKLTQEPRPMDQVAPHLTSGTTAVIMRALSRDPSHRYGSCREFTDAFRVGSSGGAVDAPAPGAQADETLVAAGSGSVGSPALSQPSGVAPVVPAASDSRQLPAPPMPPEPPAAGYAAEDDEPPAIARRRRREQRRQGRSSAEPRASVYRPVRARPARWPWVVAGIALLAVAGIVGSQFVPGLMGGTEEDGPRPIWELEAEARPPAGETPEPGLPPEMKDFFARDPVPPLPERTLPPAEEELEELADRDEEPEPRPPIPDEPEPPPAAEPEERAPEPPKVASKPPSEPPAVAPPPEPKPEPPSKPLDLPAFDVTSRSEEGVARVRTNVRASPHARAEVTNFLTPGNRVKVTGVVEGGDWLRIEASSGKVGYVKAASLADAPSKPVAPAGGKRAVVVVGNGGSILQTAMIDPATRPSHTLVRASADRGIRIGGKEHWFRFETFTVTVSETSRRLAATGGFVQTVPIPPGTPASAQVELIDANGRVLDSRPLPTKASSPTQLWVIQPRSGRLEHPIHKGRIVLEAQLGLPGGGIDIDAAGVSWSSDRDGSLGSGGVILVNLSAGEHTITAAAPGVPSRKVKVDVVHPP